MAASLPENVDVHDAGDKLVLSSQDEAASSIPRWRSARWKKSGWDRVLKAAGVQPN